MQFHSQIPLSKSCSTFLCKFHQYLPSLNTTNNPSRLLSSLFFLPKVLNPITIQSHQPHHRAESSFHTLQQWYNTTTGLYTTTGWWNSANLLTTITNLAILSPSLSPEIGEILQTSFTQAPKQNTQSSYIKTINPNSLLIETTWTPAPPPNSSPISSEEEKDANQNNGFLNYYYDDEGWWALALLQAHSLTSNKTYLATATSIFADMQSSPPTPCGGGIWWSKSHSYVNAIANELYLSVASHLANRVSPKAKQRKYIDIAVKQWTWFLNSGMINSHWTINDGLKIYGQGDCRNNNGTVWSYNQGVILGALVELSRATLEEKYIDYALKIAHAAIKKLASAEEGGILRDVCEGYGGGCGADGVQFKGVFMRGVMSLLHVVGERDGVEALREFVRRNAESVWKWDRNLKGEMGVRWRGPVREVNAGSHGSALDALVADVYVGGMK